MQFEEIEQTKQSKDFNERIEWDEAGRREAKRGEASGWFRCTIYQKFFPKVI